MSEYKVGDKFVVEIKEIFENDADDIIHEKELYRMKGFNSLVFDTNGLKKLEKVEEPTPIHVEQAQECLNAQYNRGLNDAWELSKKIILNKNFGGLEPETVKKIFDASLYFEIFTKFTAQEAFAKIEEYEKAQNEINVGDVVYADDEPESYGVVTRFQEVKAYVLWYDGSCGEERKPEELHKTGRTINISDILAEMKGV